MSEWALLVLELVTKFKSSLSTRLTVLESSKLDSFWCGFDCLKVFSEDTKDGHHAGLPHRLFAARRSPSSTDECQSVHLE